MDHPIRNTKCLQITITGMVISGTWLPKSLEKSWARIPYYIFSFFFQFVVFGSIILFQILHLFQVTDDLGKVAEVSLLLLEHLAQVAKVSAIWYKQKKIKKLLDELEGPTFNHDDPEKTAILENISKMAYTVSKTLAVASVCTGSMFGIFPILKPSLTLPLSYPFMEKGSLSFIAMYGFQISSIVINALGDTAEDFLVGGLLILISAQLDVLRHDINAIGRTPKEERNENSKDVDYENTVSCLRFHQSIISFVKELDDIFGTPVFCQFAATCLIVGLTALKITLSREPSEILTMVLYLVCILAELFLYCYPGNMVMHKSAMISEAVYCCEWSNTSVKTQRALLLMMLRSQRPLSITAGKMFNLSLDSFTVILKSSYSYFALLNRVMVDD